MVIVVGLLIAGGLLTWGHSFVTSNVRNELAQQQIYFPPKAAFAHANAGSAITPGMIPYVDKYSGQQLLTGAQAHVYADHFIAVHLSQMPYGALVSPGFWHARRTSTEARILTPEAVSAA